MTVRAVALTVLLVLGAVAGCAGEPTQGAPDPETVEYPDGFGPEGITDSERAYETHVQSLDGPYRATFQLRQTDARGTVSTAGNVTVRPEDRRSHVEVEQTAATETEGYERYHVDEEVYERISRSQNSTYERETATFSRPVYTDRETFLEMLGDLSLTATDVRVENGTERVVYRVTNVSGSRMGSTTEAANGTVVVDSEGTIRSMNVSFSQTVSGIERETTFRYAVTTDAEVRIEEPRWTDLAESAGSQQD